MGFQVEDAVRTQLKLILALIGPSGSGKTFSALRLAKGIGGLTVLIDTEHRRSLIYAPEFNFKVIHFEQPWSPERYIEAITVAENMGAENIIVDSASHEWIGPGGIMDQLDKMPGTNSYVKWATLTPRHNAFVSKITNCKANIIVCLRGKDEYVIETNEKGKQSPKKVGVGAQMRDGLEYECMASLLIDVEKHVFSVMKDNTHLFENRYEMLTEEDGRRLKEWAESGAAAPASSFAPPSPPSQPAGPKQPPSQNRLRWTEMVKWGAANDLTLNDCAAVVRTKIGDKPLESWTVEDFEKINLGIVDLAEAKSGGQLKAASQ
jgi:hypothetical protein